MTAQFIVILFCGLLAICTGIRFAWVRKIAIVDEGGFTPLAWIEGRAAIVLGCAVALGGLYLVAGAFGLVPLTVAN